MTEQDDALLDLAAHALDRGLVPAAILHLRRLLGRDPSRADGHALLAIALLRAKRLTAAAHEARQALALAPELSMAHLAHAQVLFAQGKLAAARDAFQGTLALDPHRVGALLGLAAVAGFQGRDAERGTLLRRAVALDADDTDAKVALAHWHLDRGELAEARRLAEDASALALGDLDVLVLKGHLALREGRVQEARELALWALGGDATDVGALSLLAAINARQSVWLGLWWRYSVWMLARGSTGQVLVLMAGWLAFNLGTRVAEDLGAKGAASVIEYAWLGLCVYSWVGPGLFRRALQKELESVRLKPGF